MCTLTAVAMEMKTTRIHHVSAMAVAQYSSVPHTRLTDTIFTRKGIALFSRKLRIYVPK